MDQQLPDVRYKRHPELQPYIPCDRFPKPKNTNMTARRRPPGISNRQMTGANSTPFQKSASTASRANSEMKQREFTPINTNSTKTASKNNLSNSNNNNKAPLNVTQIRREFSPLKSEEAAPATLDSSSMTDCNNTTDASIKTANETVARETSLLSGRVERESTPLKQLDLASEISKQAIEELKLNEVPLLKNDLIPNISIKATNDANNKLRESTPIRQTDLAFNQSYMTADDVSSDSISPIKNLSTRTIEDEEREERGKLVDSILSRFIQGSLNLKTEPKQSDVADNPI